MCLICEADSEKDDDGADGKRGPKIPPAKKPRNHESIPKPVTPLPSPSQVGNVAPPSHKQDETPAPIPSLDAAPAPQVLSSTGNSGQSATVGSDSEPAAKQNAVFAEMSASIPGTSAP